MGAALLPDMSSSWLVLELGQKRGMVSPRVQAVSRAKRARRVGVYSYCTRGGGVVPLFATAWKVRFGQTLGTPSTPPDTHWH